MKRLTLILIALIMCITMYACATISQVPDTSKVVSESNSSAVSEATASEESEEASDNKAEIENVESGNSFENSVISDADDTSQEGTVTIAGEEVYENIITKAIGSFAEANYMPYDYAEEVLFDGMIVTEVKISTKNGKYDSNYDCAIVKKIGKNNNTETCAVWEIVWRIPECPEMGAVGILYTPVEDKTLKDLCEKLGVSCNELSKLAFVPEEIQAMDDVTANLLNEVINTCEMFTPMASPTIEP